MARVGSPDTSECDDGISGTILELARNGIGSTERLEENARRHSDIEPPIARGIGDREHSVLDLNDGCIADVKSGVRIRVWHTQPRDKTTTERFIGALNTGLSPSGLVIRALTTSQRAAA